MDRSRTAVGVAIVTFLSELLFMSAVGLNSGRAPTNSLEVQAMLNGLCLAALVGGAHFILSGRAKGGAFRSVRERLGSALILSGVCQFFETGLDIAVNSLAGVWPGWMLNTADAVGMAALLGAVAAWLDFVDRRVEDATGRDVRRPPTDRALAAGVLLAALCMAAAPTLTAVNVQLRWSRAVAGHEISEKLATEQALAERIGRLALAGDQAGLEMAKAQVRALTPEVESLARLVGASGAPHAEGEGSAADFQRLLGLRQAYLDEVSAFPGTTSAMRQAWTRRVDAAVDAYVSNVVPFARIASGAERRYLVTQVEEQSVRAQVNAFLLFGLAIGMLWPILRLVAAQKAKLVSQAGIVAHARQFVIRTDPWGRIIWVNAAFVDATGWTLDEIRGKRPGSFLKDDRTDRQASARMAAALAQGLGTREVILNRRKDGGTYWVDIDIQPMRDEQGLLVGFQSIQTDVTALMVAEAQARAAAQEAQVQEARLEAMSETAGIGGWEYDFTQKVLIWTAQTHRIFGVPPDFVADQQWVASRIAADTLEALSRANREALATGRPYRLEFPIRTAADREVWVRVVGRGFLVDGKKRLVGAIQDISVEREEREELERKRLQAEAATIAKGQFLATISHEIRTPMNGVLGMLELLSRTTLDDEQRDRVDTARSSAGHLMAVLNDVLDVSKLEAGQVEIETLPFDPLKVAEETVRLMGGRAEEKGLILTVARADGAPDFVLGDPNRFRQVLLNLVGNALKFTERGGVDVRLDGLDGRLRVEVADTGIGLSEEARARLFQPFVQADATTTRRFGGTGLGLAICRQLVRLMDGEIGVEGRPGGGSLFWFEIAAPACAAPAVVSEPRRPEARQDRALHILAAEDHPVNQKILRLFLEMAGHRLTLVENGALAVEAARHGAFDVILMDVQMPVMDGITATRAIRALKGPASEVPIIALTANAMAGDRERYMAAGMVDYVSKPIEAGDLYEALARTTSQTPDSRPEGRASA